VVKAKVKALVVVKETKVTALVNVAVFNNAKVTMDKARLHAVKEVLVANVVDRAIKETKVKAFADFNNAKVAVDKARLHAVNEVSVAKVVDRAAVCAVKDKALIVVEETKVTALVTVANFNNAKVAVDKARLQTVKEG
jgi:hypothetical protein